MTRALVTALALAAFPLGSRGEDAAVHLTVQPMPAPKPALKYQLLPEVREMVPGNAAQNYLKCFMEQRHFFYNKEAAAERARYQAMPLAELPLDKLRNYGGGALKQADWAARLAALDWQTLDRIQDGDRKTLSDELGPFQDLAAALQVRFRVEVAERHFDDALRTAKTMFALGRHLGEHPAEVADLVGLWIVHLGLGTLEEMVQQPECPNLYWALTDLPSPLVDLRKGVQGDRTLVAADLRSLHDDVAMTESEIEQLVSHLSGVMGYAREQAGQSPRSVRARLQARVKDPEQVRAARERLIAACHKPDLNFTSTPFSLTNVLQRLVEAGPGPGLIRSFSPMQVILLDEKRDYEIQRDERMKVLALPLWQIDSLGGGNEGTTDGRGIFANFLPHIIKLRQAQGRLEQQIALLRHVEALRLHAAEHGGKLPAKLSDISVPLPVDPVSGKPFVYTLEGVTAHIRGSSVPGEESDQGSHVHYAVTLRK
jgi:hypothetical protein